ncbi:MAG: HD domain-containing protein [Epsilonproteobacteria bacterium]|nr:HD domain-containing protein [Campylobacterota bacterium]
MKKRENVLRQLRLLTMLPLGVLLIVFFYFSFNSYDTLKRMNRLHEQLKKIRVTATLINELQQERGISSGFLASRGAHYADALKGQRQKVDRALKALDEICRANPSLECRTRINIPEIRREVDLFSIYTSDVFDYYSDAIRKIETDFLRMKTGVENATIKNLLESYANLIFMKEALGQIRGAFNGIFSKKAPDENLLARINYAKGVHDNALYRFTATASEDILSKLNRVLTCKNYLWVESVFQKFVVHHQHIMIDPKIWWDRSTKIINRLYEIENIFFDDIDTQTKKQSAKIYMELGIDLVVLILLFLTVAWLANRIRSNILKNISLLNEYKTAVDQSTIVSKTDTRGVITYANDKFCEISGYSAAELLGKPHNIVRHPDMPAEAFRQMWATIKAKKTWHGIVKNRKKNGGSYIVEATIKPILDHTGEIVEYIAIRHDITEVFRLKEEVENTQRDLLFKMGEISEARSLETGNHVHRVAEYSKRLAELIGMEKEEINRLWLASPMHDIGKVAIPDSILHKQGPLTSDEWETMKQHAEIGYRIFKDSDKPLFQTAAIIAREHHERYDGTGYPRGLKGEDIHIYGRITALADVFDALSMDRCYKKAWPMEKVVSYIKEQRGRQFDPALTDLFLAHIDDFLEIRAHYS